MQYQKDELKNAILDEAEKEFSKKDFKAASLRQIALRAGTTIGNLYHYFESKEALFEALVGSEFEGFKNLIGKHSNLVTPEEALQKASVKEWREMLKAFIGYLTPIFTKRFYILLNCSEGTRYEGTKGYFIKFAKDHFLEHMDEMNSDCPRELSQVIAEQLLNGILSIIRDYEDEERKKALLTELFLFYIIGVMGLLTA